MSLFQYQALDGRNQELSGSIAADSPRQARDSLRARGLTVSQLRDLSAVRGLRLRWIRRVRGYSPQVANAIRELATLIGVGIDLVTALETVSRQQRGRFRTAILQLKERVAGGASLAEAMTDQRDFFDDLTIAMVEVGQNTGNLEQVLEQISDFQERSLQLKDRIVGAMLYPAVVFCTALAVTLFLMTVVVPMLLTNLVEAGRPLPWPTRVLKSMSDLLVSRGQWLAASAVLVIFIAIGFFSTARGRGLWHRGVLWTPVLGSIARRQAVARIAVTLATLMRSGIAYVQASEVAARVSTNLVFREALAASNHDIAAGRDIGTSLERTRVFPPLVVHVFSVGQASGRLEEMLDRLADHYNRQVASLANRLASILEPVLILVLAVIVGFILFATLLPIMEAGNVL